MNIAQEIHKRMENAKWGIKYHREELAKAQMDLALLQSVKDFDSLKKETDQ